MPLPKPFLTTAIFLLSITSQAAGAEEPKPSIPAWPTLTKNENYEVLVTFLPDSMIGNKTTRQIELNDKDCERNGNKSMEKEDVNSFITVECRKDGSLIIRRSTLKPIGKLKQELNFPPVGTSRFEILQGSDYYPDILIKVSRQSVAPSVTSGAKPNSPPGLTPVKKP